MRVDPRIYDAPQYNVEVPDTGLPQTTQYQAPQPVSQGTVLTGQQSQADALAAQAEFARPKAGVLASMGAAVSEWTPVQAYRYATAPSFEPDGINVAEMIQGINSPMAEEEREFLFQAKSHAEYNYRMEVIERQRFAQRTMGDSPIGAFVATMADPGYLALATATMGLGNVARIAGAGRAAQRTTVGVSEVATIGGAGLLEQQVRPMTDTEIIAGALLGGAATTMLYRAGKVVPSDPDFPGEVLHNLATSGTVRNPDKGILPAITFSAPDGAGRSGRELLDSIAPTFEGTEFAGLVAALRKAPELDAINVSTGDIAQSMAPKARGFMSRKGGQNLLFVRAGVEADVPLHELVHAVIQPRLLADPKLAAEIGSMRRAVVGNLAKKGDNKFLLSQLDGNDGEFLAYALTSPTFKKWAKEHEITATGETRRVEAYQRANSPVFTSAQEGVEPPKWREPTVWERIVDWVATKLGLESPEARRTAEFLSARGAYVELGRTDKMELAWKTLDDRLEELVSTAMAKDSPNLYTRGTVKRLDPNMDEVAVRARVAAVADKENIGRSIAWNLHKTLASFGPAGKSIADLLVDNPLDMAGDSVVSQSRAVRAGLSDLQFQYEDLLTKELAARGAGIKQRILQPRKALDTQRALEKEIQLEMLRRERNTRLGLEQPSRASESVQKMADSLDKVYAAALKEMQAAGVAGADAVSEMSGYFSRKWDISNIDEAKAKLQRLGRTPKEADAVLRKIVEQGLRRANGWDAQLSRDVAKAILDRTHRKGYFEDAAFRSHAGNAAAKEVRDILEGAGLRGDRLQKAMNVLTGVVDEGGKLSSLKHRLDIDMKAGVALPDGSTLTVSDLINSDLTRGTEAYLDQVAGRVAMARKGLPNVTDLDNLRTQLMESIPEVSERAKAAKLFDNTVDSILGRPTGEDLPDAMRNMQAVTRMVGLASSGLWQTTEYATAMGRFGALKVLGAAMKEASFAAIRRPDRATSTQLADVLSRNSSADIRIRPYINRLEDNFDVPTGAIVQSALLQAQQLVPYLNAQKLVQTHQARMVSNLVVDTFRKAGDGDQKAIKALELYGLEPHIMTRIQGDLKAGGMDTSKWSHDTWAAVRGPLQKMMDDSVLRNRTGEIPAFAQFSQVGKFVFTFRSFVLGAHNKVLAGTISRDGLAGISLLMLYQFPLVLLATQANSTIQGKEIKSTEELIAKAFGQMGSLGLFSELFGVVTGEKQQFGAPGFIAVDRMYKLAGATLSGDPGAAVNAAIQAAPLLSIVPGARAIGETFKESKE